ncbi:hypothetical protein F9C29_35000, partial [Enterobacter hormaechei]
MSLTISSTGFASSGAAGASGIVTAEQQAPNTISASNSIFNVQALGQLQAFAGLMAQSVVTVPAHLAG